MAITNTGLVALGHDQVTFRYRDRRDASAGAWRTMTLSADEFLRRFLQHVLPRGFHKVRYYGIWHPAAAPLRARLTLALAPTARAAPCATPERAMAAAASAGPVPAAVPITRPCPRCEQGLLRLRRVLARAPQRSATARAP